MAGYRRGRVNDETVRELSEIIREVKDPRVQKALVSITAADVTADMKLAFGKIGEVIHYTGENEYVQIELEY